MIRARSLVSAMVLSAALTGATAGCHKNPPPVTPASPPPPPPPAATPAPPAPPPPPPPAAAPAPRPLTEEEIFARKSVDQLNSEKPLDDVFFDLDRSDIRDDGKSVLQRDADWLKKWPTTQVTVEGHADSRGSSEYNLGLGSRRRAAGEDHTLRLGGAAGPVILGSKSEEEPLRHQEEQYPWGQRRPAPFLDPREKGGR